MWLTAALVVGAAWLTLAGVAAARAAAAPVLPGYRAWSGDYAQVWAWLLWTLGDTTEPGYAHSALAGAMMLLGGYAAHWAFVRDKDWRGFAVTSGTGLFPWAIGSAAVGLLLSNLAWGWTITVTGMWQPFVPFASVPFLMSEQQ